MQMTINLLVLRCRDMEHTRRFYELLGFEFTREAHGTGPVHYASQSAGFVLELYPIQGEQLPDQVRLGFAIPLLADVSGDIRHSADVTVLKPPHAAGDRLTMLVRGTCERPEGAGLPPSSAIVMRGSR